MDAQEMTAYIKAIADTDRLQIIGLLAQRPCRFSEINEVLSFEPRDTSRHLDLLIQGNVIRFAGDHYRLDKEGLENLSRQQFKEQRRAYLPSPDLENYRQQVLVAHLNADGTLKTIPLQPAKRQIILDYLVNAFTIGVKYTEREVNMILKQFHPDAASLRRYLVDAAMLNRVRDGSTYWRPK